MLKLNATSGKLDITISDEAVFGENRKSTIKQQPQRRAVASRASNPHGKQQNKPPATRFAEKGQKGRESRQSKSTKKGPAVKQIKPQTRQRQKAVQPLEVSTSIPAKGGSGKSTGSSVITQAKLDSILTLLNNTPGNGTATNLSPEQLSVLVTSLSKAKSTEPQDNEESLQSQRNKTHDQRTIPKETPSTDTGYTAKQDNQAEDKKAQWKRELDEQVASKNKAKDVQKQKADNTFVEYNPWGRPGAGAPIRSESGAVLADYHHRAPKENYTEKSNQDNVFNTSILQTSISSHGPPTTNNQTHPSPVTTAGSSTSNIDTALPVALRSSFAVGAPGLVSSDTQQKKRLEELKWKQELEQQIEDKKERERQRKQKEEQEDLLNFSWSNKHTRPAPKQQPFHHNVIETPSHTSDVQQHKPSPENNFTHGTQDSTSPLLNASLNGSLNRTHARGFGMHSMDPQSKTEADKKRSKMLEHQRAIQEQVEENRRRKLQEKEQRLKEEAIEEARLAKERELLNQGFAIEQKRKKDKEEEAKRLSEALQQSVLDAHEAAQQAKMEKRRKHLEVGGHTTARGGNSSRSYVVSRTPSLAHHAARDSITSSQDNRQATVDVVHDNRQTILSNYTTPRVTGRETNTNKAHGRTSNASQSRSSRNDPFVPPLNLIRGDSPPVPTLRSKVQHAKPAPHRSITPASVKDRLHRTVSSHSEPCDGSMALSTRRDTLRKELEDVLTPHEELTSARLILEEGSPPFYLVEDAFMIPYHRTDSATLPAPPETPENATSTETKPLPRTKGIGDKKTTKKLPTKDGSTVTPMYRSTSTHLKTDQPKTQVSPRRTKGMKQATKPSLSPRGVVKRSIKDRTTSRSVSQLSSKKDVDRKRQTKDKLSPRMDASSGLSTHQEIPEPLPTARQEMILQQLAALRQGLILKERELKQVLQS